MNAPKPPAAPMPRTGSGRTVDLEVVASVALLSLVLAIGMASVRDYGIGTDEFVMDAQGPRFLAWYTSGFTDRAWLTDVDARLYGAWFDMLIAFLQSLRLAEPFWIRHVTTLLVGLGGLVAVIQIGRVAIGPWVGLTAAALCLTTGYFYGQLFFSPVDIPFMAAMSWAILAIHIMARARVPSWAVTGTVALVTGLAIATRIGGVLSQAYLVGAMALCALDVMVREERGGREALIAIGLRTGVAIVAGWAVAIALWPWLNVGNPVAQLNSAYQFFSRVRLDFHFPYWGTNVSSQVLPWHYVQGQLLARLSEAFVVLLLVALALGAATLFGLARTWLGGIRQDGVRGLAAPAAALAGARGFLLILAAAVTPMMVTWVSHPVLYDGVRHFLFVIPPLGLIAAWALIRISPLARRIPTIAALSGGLYVGATIANLMALHPLEYVAINAFAGGTSERFDLDYWSEAAGVAIRRLDERLRHEPAGASTQMRPRVMVCIPWRVNLVGQMLPDGWLVATNRDKADYIIETQRSGACAAGSGRVIDEVIRRDIVFARTIATRDP
jgi:hypothetical protein